MMNIHQAAFSGKNDLIRQYLAEDPASVNQTLELREGDTIRKVTPIFLAVIAGKFETVKLLLDNNAETNFPEDGESLYDWAMLSCTTHKLCKLAYKSCNRSQNYFEKITLNQFKINRLALESLLKINGFEQRLEVSSHLYYLASGEIATVDQVQAILKDNPDEHACLCIALGALAKGNQPVLDYLTSTYDFNFSTRIQGGTFDGHSADTLAAHCGYVKVFPKLKVLGIPLNLPIPSGKNLGITSLYVAGRTSRSILEYLKDCGFDINTPVQSGKFAGLSSACAAAIHGNLETLALLKEIGCDLNAPALNGSCEGMTPACLAAEWGQVESLKYLKENGCDLNAPALNGSYEGMTPACFAAEWGQVESLKYLKENGCDLNAPIASGMTLACFAASNDQVEILKYLKENGCDLNAPIASGTTLACFAAEWGQVESLKYLKENGCDLNVPVLNGINEGKTPACFAASKGKVEILKYLKEIGCDLNAPMASGKFAGMTPACFAAEWGQVEILKYLYENGFEMNLLSPISNGVNQMSKLLKKNRIAVLNALQELGFDLDIPVGAVVPSKLPGVKKLTSKDRVALTYYQLQVHKSWFATNKDRFLREMEDISAEEWVQGRSWDQIYCLYKVYLELGGLDHQWLMNVLVPLINHSTPLSHEEIDELFKNVDLKKISLEDLKKGVTPGKLLLALLERLANEQVRYGNDQLMYLQQWVSLLLLQKGGDETFWTLSRDYLKAIRLKIKTKAVHQSQRGKGRGPKVKKDALEPLWDKFEPKIEKAVTSSEELQAVIALKDRDLSKQFLPLPQKISACAEKLERKWKEVRFSDSEDPIEMEYLMAKAQRVSTFLDQLLVRSKSEKKSLDQIRACFLKHDFRALNKISTLQDDVNTVGSKLLAEGKTKVATAEAQFGDMERRLEADLATLEESKKFKLAQREMLQEARFDSHLLPTKSIRKKVRAREDTVWKEHMVGLNRAQTIHELQNIRNETEKKWSEVGKLLELKKVVQSEKPSRAQRIEYYKDLKISEQKREIDRLVQEVERFKQSALRAPSPEKIIPVVEAPLIDRLIKKLEKIAFISKPAQDALKMINQRRDILTKVTEIEKFLALFEITYDRTKGSHSTYTDRQTNVVIADHDGDSKDYQIKAALEAVYEKLTRKK